MTNWQYEIFQDLAKLTDFPETPEAEWHVRRPTAQAYKAAVDLISIVPIGNAPRPRIAPDRRGGIQFEWEKGAFGLEIGVSPEGVFECLKVTADKEEEISGSANKARDLLLWFAKL
jgi:hypothetical protein